MLVEDGKADVVEGHLCRCGDHDNGVLQWGRDGAQLQTQPGELEFMAKEQVGPEDGKSLRGTIRGYGGIWLN